MSGPRVEAKERVLLTAGDPDAVARATESALGESLPWVRPDEPGAAAATVWFCAGSPPAQTMSLPGLRWIHSGWAGVEDWFARAEWRDGVRLANGR